MLMNDFDRLTRSLKKNHMNTDLSQETRMTIIVWCVTQTVNHTFSKYMTWFNPPQPLLYIPLPQILSVPRNNDRASAYVKCLVLFAVRFPCWYQNLEGNVYLMEEDSPLILVLDGRRSVYRLNRDDFTWEAATPTIVSASPIYDVCGQYCALQVTYIRPARHSGRVIRVKIKHSLT